MKLLSLVILFVTASCAASPAMLPDGRTIALGEKAYVDGPVIMPVAILEDSRCPANARCAWAGQVRLKAVWVRKNQNQPIELTLGKGLPLADGVLTLTDVRPAPMTGSVIKASDYRFTITFEGGL
ncbi:MAG: hypothetical protein ACRCY3_14000 [Sphingorhabdus sp.]